jgi:hypothetical protein
VPPPVSRTVEPAPEPAADVVRQPAAAEPVPAPAAAAEPAAAPPPGEAAPEGRRRRRLVPLALAAGVLVVVGVLLAVLLTRGGGTPSAAGRTGTSSAPPASSSSATPPPSSSSAPAPSSSSAPPPTTTSAAPTTTSAAPAAGSSDPATFLANYHALLPGNTQAAYQLTGPSLRSAESYPDYRAFWGRFTAVSLSNVQVQSPTSATGVLTYTFQDGHRQSELHRFTFVQDGNGRLLLDRDSFVSAA